MKTAICIDSLLLRDDSIFLTELILNVFPNSEIYTIVHKQGGILGPIESRPIISSFLTHRVKKSDVLKKNFWIIPSAVKAIPLHPSIEKVIIISRGYIHGLNFPNHVERFLYIYDWDIIEQKNLGWQRFFRAFVNDWREKALTRFPKIAVSSEALKERLELPNAEVIGPTFRTEEYPFVKDEDHNFEFSHHLLYTHGMNTQEFEAIASFLVEKGEMVRVMGPDQHLESLKKKYPMIDFAGDHCEATAAMYSHQAKVIWDLSLTPFPSKAFGAHCTGRPVVVWDRAVNREYLKDGAFFLTSLKALETVYQEIQDQALSFDRRSLRRAGLRWNERLFKSRMVKFLERNKD
jgi:hypothetical protein